MAQKTFAQMFYLEEAGAWRRLRRDLALIRYLFAGFKTWATVGRRVRRDYRRAQAAGEVYPIDRLDPARRPK